MSIRLVISSWIKKYGVKYPTGSVEIHASKQDTAIPELLNELKESGFSAEEVVSYIPNILSPLVPGSVKILKKTKKFYKIPDHLLKKKLLQWCWSVAKNFTDIFNKIYFGEDSEKYLDFKDVYKAMCQARRLEVPEEPKQDITDSDIEEHFNTPNVEPIRIFTKKEQKESETDTLNLNYDKIMIIDPNNLPDDYPEFSDVDLEALEFFGLLDVPKEKL